MAVDSWGEESPSIVWSQWEPIEAGGAFELKSIPRGGQIQAMAFCDGFVSTTEDAKEKFFVTGQRFDVDEDEVNTEITMERTGTLEVASTTPDGEPPEGGTGSS